MINSNVYWYRAQLYIAGRFCDWIFLKSDYQFYQQGDTIVKRYASGIVLKIRITYCFGDEKPSHIMELDSENWRVFPKVISEI